MTAPTSGCARHFISFAPMHGLLVPAKRMKKHQRQSRRIKNAHPCILAHPRLPCGWQVKVEGWNALCERELEMLYQSCEDLPDKICNGPLEPGPCKREVNGACRAHEQIT